MKKKRKNSKKILMKNREGVSPVIATVLLIAMVVVIGLIVFLWFRGLVVEEGIKFGKNVKLNCPDVSFDASYSGGKISIVNRKIPLYKLKIKIFKEGGYDTEDFDNWPDKGLNQGETFSEIIDASGATKIVLIPVLVGDSGESKKAYICEDQYGYEISV